MAHIHTAQDDSLESRIQAFQAALQAQRDLESNLEKVGSKEWDDRLGMPEDIAEAGKIIEESLSVSAKAIDLTEVSLAVNKGLLDKDSADSLMSAKGQDKSLDTDQELINDRMDSIREARSKSEEIDKDLDIDKSL